MSAHSPVERFRTATETLSPARTLVLLYERLQRDLVDAEDAITSGDRYRAHQALLHAQEIVAELDVALDASQWSDAARLSSIYRFITSRLIAANVGQDAAAVRDCRAVVDPLVDTWREAWQQQSSAAAAPAAAPPAGEVRRVPLDVTG